MMYPYDRLKEEGKQIRLLVLLPLVCYTIGGEQLIKCSLTTSIPDEQKYEALSYAWGDATVTRSILVDGFIVHVTENLEAALRRLRLTSQPRHLWVDAVCINQKDLEEKQWQVRQMAEIFQQADKVIAWLGDSDRGSDEAMNALRYVGSAAVQFGFQTGYNHEIAQQWAGIEVSQITPASAHNDSLLDFYIKLTDVSNHDMEIPIGHVLELFRRPWWGRLWVIQEVVHASNLTFVCGRNSIPSEHLMAVQGAYRTLAGAIIKQHSRDIGRLRSIYETGIIALVSRTPSLLQIRDAIRGTDQLLRPKNLVDILQYVLIHGPPFEATEPRDHVYALLGIAADVQELSIQPDYTLSCQDVYVNATMKLLVRGDLGILNFCQPRKSKPNLPTWVPGWSQLLQAPILPYRKFYSTGYTLENPRMHKYIIDFENNSNEQWVLRIAGARLSSISSVTRTWNELNYRRRKYRRPKYSIEEKARRWFRNNLTFLELGYDEMAERLGSRRTSRQQMMCAMIRMSCAEQERASIISPRKRMSEATVLELSAGVTRDKLPLDDPMFQQYLLSIELIARNRRPFFTDWGQVGIGPLDARVDDLLVLFLGADMPYILRECEGGRYQLVGECYVDGIMDGQALEDATFECFHIV